jgi:hypothetical protein
MDEQVTFEVPGAPPSPNARLHHHARGRLVAEYKMAAHYMALHALNTHRGSGFPWSRVDVEYRAFGPGARPDNDNLVARSKPILDGIVTAGIVANDDPLHVHDIQAHDGGYAKRTSTLVTVRRCEHEL